MRRMLAVHVVMVFAALSAACAAPHRSLDSVAEGYVRATLQLAQHDPSLVESWRGPADWKPGPRVPVATTAGEIRGLREAINDLGDPANGADRARAAYLRAQLQALAFVADRFLGDPASIDDQARNEFGVSFPALDSAAIERTLAELEHLLPGAGALADRVAALRHRTTIPEDRKQAVMQLALDACRDAVAPRIGFPTDERVTMEFRPNMAWDAVARDEGNHHTNIEISDGPLDLSRAYHLACHEGYAGHHAQYLLIDRIVLERRWHELQLTPAFGPHVLYIEGAAEVGADLALSAEQRTALYRERLMPAAGLPTNETEALIAVEDRLPSLLPVVTDVARQYLDNTIDRKQAIDRLRNEALIGNPSGTLAFIERRRARALVYGEGRRLVNERLGEHTLAGLHDLFRTTAAVQ